MSSNLTLLIMNGINNYLNTLNFHAPFIFAQHISKNLKAQKFKGTKNIRCAKIKGIKVYQYKKYYIINGNYDLP